MKICNSTTHLKINVVELRRYESNSGSNVLARAKIGINIVVFLFLNNETTSFFNFLSKVL